MPLLAACRNPPVLKAEEPQIVGRGTHVRTQAARCLLSTAPSTVFVSARLQEWPKPLTSPPPLKHSDHTLVHTS